MEDLAVKIGKIIREKRNEKGYTTQELANKVGVSAGLINNIENARTDTFNLKLLFDLCDCLNIPVQSLVQIDLEEFKNFYLSTQNVTKALAGRLNLVIDKFIETAIKNNYDEKFLDFITQKLLYEIEFYDQLKNSIDKRL